MATAIQPNLLSPASSSSRLRYDLRAIRADGALTNAMIGMGENYFAPFALAIGIGQAASGLVTTIPLFLGAVLQLIAPWGVQLLGSYRRWVVTCATLQALSFLPMALVAVAGRVWPPLLFLMIALYWGCGLATVPAWNTWVGHLVPLRMRARYFACRTRVTQAALLGGFLLAGFSLQWATRFDLTLVAFAVLFGLALICRLGASAFLYSQSEVGPPSGSPLPLAEIAARFRHSSEGRLLVYLIAIQAAVQISGPYFTPFMLKQIGFSYGTYATLIGTSFLAKIVAVPWWGWVAHHHGPRRLMWFGGIGVIPMAALWLVSQSFAYLVCLQAFSGICWAAYELAMFLLLFDSIDENERVSILTAYNFASATATATGALLGALILAICHQSYGAYLGVFLCSSLCRLATLALLFRIPSGKGQLSRPIATTMKDARPSQHRIDSPHQDEAEPHFDSAGIEPAGAALAAV